MTSGVARCLAEVRLALSVAAVAGCVLGVREGLLTLEANAFVQPEHYLLAYVGVPILCGLALAALVVLPVALARACAVRALARGRSLALYAGFLGFGGGVATMAPWATALLCRLRAVGFEPGRLGVVALWLLALGVAAGAALVAVVIAGSAARSRTLLHLATRTALLLGVMALWPAVRFAATDWRWPPVVPHRNDSSAPGPNLVLISIDTLRADHLSAYGGPRGLTPNLDRLAEAGVTFRDTITSAPWTLPAVASLMTGLHPRHHRAGVVTNRRDPLGRAALASGSWTLAGALRARGYRTQAIVTNPYLALRYGLGDGFGGYENLTIESEFFLATREVTAVRLLTWLVPDLVIGDRGDTVSARATAWLERAARDRPFFLWLHYVDPHAPYSRPGASRHKSFRGDSLLTAESSTDTPLTLSSPDIARLRSGELRLDDREKEAVRALYRGEVAYVDAAVGRVLGALDRLGLGERTLVVCLSDHGEEFWEHGGVEHGHTVYEEVVRIPLLMRWPVALPSGAAVESVARIVDVSPTILDLLGIPAPAHVDGVTLLPLLRGAIEAPRIALVENMLFSEERIGVRTADRKYVRWDSGKEEAYDLVTDPGESRDLAGLATAVQPLRELLATFERTIGRRALIARTPPPDGDSRGMLRALGYVQ